MMPYHAYQILEAERPKTDTARRAADMRLGEMAGAMAQLADELAPPARALRRLFLRTGTGERERPSRPAVAESTCQRYV